MTDPVGARETIFITGVPGFIGKRVASWAFATGHAVQLLVQPRFQDAAGRFLEGARARWPHLDASVFPGDISAPGLGLSTEAREAVVGRATLAVHLAAAYDLRLARDVGLKVNVEGTRNVLDLLQEARALKRLGYVSTTAISGSCAGRFSEDDFDVGQTPKNFYEETKFLAEALVRERWARLPTVIFRPTIVVGDSQTGEADKIDGPYYGMVMIRRGMHLVAPRSKALCHLVPVDFVVSALTTLLTRSEVVGRVFHLGDPAPVTYDQFFDIVCAAMGRPRPILRLPPAVLKPFFALPVVSRLTGVPRQSFEYTGVPVEYPCSNTQEALAGTGLACPPFAAYAPRLVAYLLDHLLERWTDSPRW